jgi:hypothetical protein
MIPTKEWKSVSFSKGYGVGLIGEFTLKENNRFSKIQE